MVDSATPPSRSNSSAAAEKKNKTEDFKLRHWRSSPPSLRRRHLAASTVLLPAISIPNGNHRQIKGISISPPSTISPPSCSSSTNYTSLRDLIGSPPQSSSSAAVRNRLVVRAAHAYLQLTPSGAETCSYSRRRRRRNGANSIWRCCYSCFGFLCRLFGLDC